MYKTKLFLDKFIIVSLGEISLFILGITGPKIAMSKSIFFSSF